MKKVLGIIPARKDSKGLPGKNKKLLGGKPLIAHSIEAGLKVKHLDLFITTDDLEILDLGHNYYNLDTSYIRPKHLALDQTPMHETVAHLLSYLKDTKNLSYDYFILLQPTSPFRTALDIEKTVSILLEKNPPSVVGVSPMWTHPIECVNLENTDDPTDWHPLLGDQAHVASRRQDFKGCYQFINGAIYGMSCELFLKERKFVFPRSYMLIMDEINTIDIDTERDFKIAQAFF